MPTPKTHKLSEVTEDKPTRLFTTLNWPDHPDDTGGVQLYTVFESIPDKSAEFGQRHVRVADGLTIEEANAFILKHGEFDA